MIKVAETNGPYIVITKHLAMPHARAEDGVNKIGISIAVLKDPVEFGNKSNDPVKYVFCLAAIDNFTHLRAMGDLAEILAYDTFYQVLNNAKDPQEIHLAHELFHYDEFVNGQEVSDLLDKVEISSLFGKKRYAGIRKTSEIAANSFAMNLLQLDTLPSYYDYVFLQSTNEITQRQLNDLKDEYNKLINFE